MIGPKGEIIFTKQDYADCPTKQSMKDECDINTIVARFDNTGVLSHIAETPGIFADVSGMTDFRSALEQVKLAEEAFMELPAKVRARFENDPVAFVDFCNTPGNEAELKALGLWAEGRSVEPPKKEDRADDKPAA